MSTAPSKNLNRRQFVRQAACAGFGATVALVSGCGSDEGTPAPTPLPSSFTIDLSEAQYASLQSIGGAVLKNGVIIIRRSNTVYVALSTVCTHASCSVDYSSNTNRLVCPCHGSVFSNTGSVLQGPAAAPLTSYPVTVTGNKLTVQP